MVAGSTVGIGLLIAGAIVAALRVRRQRIMRRQVADDDRRRPRDAQGIVEGAAEIRLTGRNGAAVLVVHGFNDTPQSMAYLSTRLHSAGFTVHAMRLPGHGTSLIDMAQHQRAAAWRSAVHTAYGALCATHAPVVICGQSMGGALAVLEAVSCAPYPPPTALALLAPFLGMAAPLRREIRLGRLIEPFLPFVPSAGGERSIHDPEARAKALSPGLVTLTTLRALEQVALAAEAVLGQLIVPTLYLQSRQDNRISEASARTHYHAIASRDKDQQWMDGSGHILSADYERSQVADLVIAWFDRWIGD